MTDETPGTSPESSLVRPKHGHGLLKRGGSNAGSGRPPEEWRDLCRQALKDAGGLEVVKMMVNGELDAKANDRMKAIQFLASYAEGLPVQRVETEALPPRESAEVVATRLLNGLSQVIGVLGLETAQKVSMLQRLKELEGLQPRPDVVEGEWEVEGTGTPETP